MAVRSIHPSPSHAKHAQSKPEEAAPYAFTKSARRNSVMDFAAEYSLRRSSPAASRDGSPLPAKTIPTKLTKRDSILRATGDTDHLLEVRLAVEELNGAFDSIDNMDTTRHHGARGKFSISPEGDMVLLNKIEVECAASEAVDMLWDHRESSVTKIAGDIIAGCEVKGTVNANQRILYLRYQKPSLGVAGSTSARDASVVADKSAAASAALPIITFSSVTTQLIPPDENYVRGDTKVLGFAVQPIEANKCSIFFTCEFAMNGAFSNPLTKCLLKCTGFDKMAARNCSIDCNTALCRLRTFLELRAKKKQAELV